MTRQILDKRALLGEGPAWDERLGILFWVDIRGRLLHAYDPANGNDREYNMPGLIGTVAPWTDDKAVVALDDGIYGVELASGKTELLVSIENDIPGNRFNDGKCDPAGRLWAGTMSNAEKGDRTGSLYRIDPDLTVKKFAEDIYISNGIGFSPDNRVMYYIDTGNRQVDVFDYDIRTGDATNRRRLFEIPENQGGPDGMTVDGQGMLWVAQWGGRRVVRYNPENGEQLLTVDVPAHCTSSCCFGGKNMDELYITTAGGAQYTEDNRGGSLFMYNAGVRGARSYRFGRQP